MIKYLMAIPILFALLSGDRVWASTSRPEGLPEGLSDKSGLLQFFESWTADSGRLCPPLTLGTDGWSFNAIEGFYNGATNACDKAEFAWQLQGLSEESVTEKKWADRALQNLFAHKDHRGALTASLALLRDSSSLAKDAEFRLWPLRIAMAAYRDFGAQRDPQSLNWLLGLDSDDPLAVYMRLSEYARDFPDRAGEGEFHKLEFDAFGEFFLRLLERSKFHATYVRGTMVDWIRNSQMPMLARFGVLNRVPSLFCTYFANRAAGSAVDGNCKATKEMRQSYLQFIKAVMEEVPAYALLVQEYIVVAERLSELLTDPHHAGDFADDVLKSSMYDCGDGDVGVNPETCDKSAVVIDRAWIQKKLKFQAEQFRRTIPSKQ